MQRFTSFRPDELSWHVAKLCNAGNCVTIATNGVDFFIGDSKAPRGPILSYSRGAWINFIEGIRQGDFDHLI
jgi:hypothetical protein